ncbi:MAG: HAMP domain-containing sensor histidine kinase [Parvibaculaceae bacterium]|nr:HAMP domain-containing sensor histidine kinase [Parvibaculaceae bacterium]
MNQKDNQPSHLSSAHKRVGGVRTVVRRITGPISRSLSAKLLVLTGLFVLIAEIMIFVPSIANFRDNWLKQRIHGAQIATLALEATPDQMVSEGLENELLRNAEVYAVILHRDEARRLILTEKMPPDLDASYDLRKEGPLDLVMEAFATLFAQDGRTIRIIGMPRFEGGDFIEIVIDETPLRAAMFGFGRNIFWLSIFISLLTAGLVYLALHVFLVRPMRSLTENMTAFRDHPEDARRVIVPSSRVDEIGVAERELADMQRQLRETLNQKSRLASLGAAVSKINHDLRNILANVQLISDRLGSVSDPTVQKLAPRLFASLDRAIGLCTRTLQFGSAEEQAPSRELFPLSMLVEELHDALGLEDRKEIRWETNITADLVVDADSDQLLRVLMNLTRNALQAIDVRGDGGTLSLNAERSGKGITITLSDTGPGLPPAAQTHLFEAFNGSTKSDGSGLGLAIASELITAHGGDLALTRTGPEGTVFTIHLPDRVTDRGVAQ